MKRRSNKVVKMRRMPQINIGVIVFLIIFIYITIISVIYLSKQRILIYEVTEKNISDDNTYQGIAIRKEEIVKTDKGGYINYYMKEGSRIGKNEVVYTVDETGNIYNTLLKNENNERMNKDSIQKIRDNINVFRSLYSNQNYKAVETLKSDLENTILEIESIAMSENLKKVISNKEKKNLFNIVKSKKSGIIAYYTDEFEQIDADSITTELFDTSTYQKQQLRSQNAISEKTPVYKLITDENWNIVLNLSKKQYENLIAIEKENDNSIASIKITFSKDGITTTVPFSTYQKGKGYFAKLELNKYMVRYASERFIDIEIASNTAKGLKIPKSAILKKDFYQIPIEYFTEGGNSGKRGLVKEVYDKNGGTKFEFIEAEPYKEDEKYGYVSIDLFSQGDWIRNEETQDKYQITKIKKLLGVYNANQGYCIFKYIEKLYENKEYCIVKKDTKNGLSVYDHIIADAKTAEDQQIISQ